MDAGEVVVIDAACEYSMYASDLTRTMPVNGKFTARQKEIYNIVLGAQSAARDAFVVGKSKMGGVAQRGADGGCDLPGQGGVRLHQHAWKGSARRAPGEVLSAWAWARGSGSMCMTRRITTQPWQIGSVFTIEPGIYIPEEKIGVRIEDTYFVDGSGKLVDFAEKLPHTAEEVEAAMRG